MEIVNEILYNEKYRELLNELNELEKERKFCRHNIEHFLDVARIAYIEVLEQKLDYKKEIIYTIALLHDIGRVEEYKNGIPHNKASMDIAEEILGEIKFSGEEKHLILECIYGHRGENDLDLAKIISRSDKISRRCFDCGSERDCYWPAVKKNMNIKI